MYKTLQLAPLRCEVLFQDQFSPGALLGLCMWLVLQRIQGWKPIFHNTQATFACPTEKHHHITKVRGNGHAFQ